MSCTGCRSIMVTITNENECQYTIREIKDLLECPCKECLVKLMCNTTCPLFNDNIRNMINKNRLSQNVTSRLTREDREII